MLCGHRVRPPRDVKVNCTQNHRFPLINNETAYIGICVIFRQLRTVVYQLLIDCFLLKFPGHFLLYGVCSFSLLSKGSALLKITLPAFVVERVTKRQAKCEHDLLSYDWQPFKKFFCARHLYAQRNR